MLVLVVFACLFNVLCLRCLLFVLFVLCCDVVFVLLVLVCGVVLCIAWFVYFAFWLDYCVMSLLVCFALCSACPLFLIWCVRSVSCVCFVCCGWFVCVCLFLLVFACSCLFLGVFDMCLGWVVLSVLFVVFFVCDVCCSFRLLCLFCVVVFCVGCQVWRGRDAVFVVL